MLRFLMVVVWCVSLPLMAQEPAPRDTLESGGRAWGADEGFFSGDGKYLVLNSGFRAGGGQAILWDIGAHKATLVGQKDGRARISTDHGKALFFSADGKSLILLGYSVVYDPDAKPAIPRPSNRINQIEIVDLASGKRTFSSAGEHAISAVSRDGAVAIVAKEHGSLLYQVSKPFDLDSCAKPVELEGLVNGRLSQDGKSAVFANREGCVLYEVGSGKSTKLANTRLLEKGELDQMFSPDGKVFVLRFSDKSNAKPVAGNKPVEAPKVVEPPNFADRFKKPPLGPTPPVVPQPPVKAPVKAPLEPKVTANADNNKILLFETGTGRRIAMLSSKSRPVGFSGDGSMLLMVVDSELHVHSAADGKFLRKTGKTSDGDLSQADHLHIVLGMEGTLMATHGRDGIPRVWDLATGKALVSFPAMQSPFVALSVDGKTLATSRKDLSIDLWNVTRP